MKLKWIIIAAALLATLAACGPADVEQAATDAVATATTLIPEGAAATAEALANDPTVEALVNEAASAIADPGVQAALEEAFNSVNNEVTATQGEAIALDALSAVEGVTSTSMTIVSAPAGAAGQAGQTVAVGSDGTVAADEWSRYFTVAGDYRVRVDVTTSGGVASQEITITVP